jgi:hypothetical protein
MARPPLPADVDIGREIPCATGDVVGDLLSNADPSSRILKGYGGGRLAKDHLAEVLDLEPKAVIGWQLNGPDLTVNLNPSSCWAGSTERAVKLKRAVLTHKREALREWTGKAAPRRPERS